MGQIMSPFFGHESSTVFIRNLWGTGCFFVRPDGHSALRQTQPDRSQLVKLVRLHMQLDRSKIGHSANNCWTLRPDRLQWKETGSFETDGDGEMDREIGQLQAGQPHHRNS